VGVALFTLEAHWTAVSDERCNHFYVFDVSDTMAVASTASAAFSSAPKRAMWTPGPRSAIATLKILANAAVLLKSVALHRAY
jgi:hypothetical protein